MNIFKLSDMQNGWYAGNFKPTAFKTELFESCYRVHKKGEHWDTHFHKEATEVNLLISGKMKLQGKTLVDGDIFILSPYEIADPIFLEDCAIMCIKTPAAKNDKFCCKC